MPELSFDYSVEAQKVKEMLRTAFPQDTIATDEGYNGRVHVKVVSDKFNGKSEKGRQDMLWEILNAKLGPDAQVVSLALAYGTDEL